MRKYGGGDSPSGVSPKWVKSNRRKKERETESEWLQWSLPVAWSNWPQLGQSAEIADSYPQNATKKIEKVDLEFLKYILLFWKYFSEFFKVYIKGGQKYKNMHAHMREIACACMHACTFFNWWPPWYIPWKIQKNISKIKKIFLEF